MEDMKLPSQYKSWLELWDVVKAAPHPNVFCTDYKTAMKGDDSFEVFGYYKSDIQQKAFEELEEARLSNEELAMIQIAITQLPSPLFSFEDKRQVMSKLYKVSK